MQDYVEISLSIKVNPIGLKPRNNIVVNAKFSFNKAFTTSPNWQM